VSRLRAAGTTEDSLATLANRTVSVVLDNALGVVGLLRALRNAMAWQPAERLADKVVLSFPLDHADEVAELLDGLRKARAVDARQMKLLAERVAAELSLDEPGYVAWVIKSLQRAGAADLAARLAKRAAGSAALDDPRAVAELLRELRKAEAWTPTEVLAERVAAAGVLRYDWPGVHRLLQSLRDVGHAAHATNLRDLLPAAGMFDLFCREAGSQFRFGLCQDGSPAQPWSWDNLN
jgi:hypothetical protein